ncbi:MAG: hypothetical protein AB1563_08270 [Bacillota bacterium]
MKWWEASPERWEWEVHRMSEKYPGWRSYDRRLWLRGVLSLGVPEVFKAWKGEIRPFDGVGNPDEVIAALDQNRYVLVARGGRVMASPDDRPHKRSALPASAGLMEATFLLEATYMEPPAHPKVELLRPRPSPEAVRETHFYKDGSICPLYPPDGTWDWSRPDSMAEYLDTVAIWLAKYAYWEFTRRHYGKGIWVGSAIPHGKLGLLSRIPCDSQCYCRSGLKFRECHGRDLC